MMNFIKKEGTILRAMSAITKQLISLSTLTAYNIATPSQTLLILIGAALLVLLVALIGGILLLSRRKATSKQNTVITAFDTSILPNLHSVNVASVFRRRDELPISLISPSTPPSPYGSVLAPVPAMPSSTTPTTPPLGHLSDTQRPQVSSETSSRQQPELDSVLEAMIRQAQRGIFATPGKGDLS